jgi:hypothetical protein
MQSSNEARKLALAGPETKLDRKPTNTTKPTESKGGKRIRVKFPGQSWSIKEKMDFVTAICADQRFSHGEVRAAVTMAIYFHNTQSGALFPSREQVAEQACVSKNTVIATTRKMKRFGYVHYEQSHGGRNERNTYHLRKQFSVRTVSKPETVQPLNAGGSEFELAGVQNLNSHIPLESTLEGNASPLPCKSKASALQKSKPTKAKRGESQKATKKAEDWKPGDDPIWEFNPVDRPTVKAQPLESPLSLSPEERETNLTRFEQVQAELRKTTDAMNAKGRTKT